MGVGSLAEARPTAPVDAEDAPRWIGPRLSLRGDGASGDEPRYVLRNEWLNMCAQGELGMCVKTDCLTLVPDWLRRQCPEHAERASTP